MAIHSDQIKSTGKWGEDQAEKYLRKKGYRTIERNFSCRFGEIDLIVSDRTYLVFVEVKTRERGRPGDGLLTINAGKQKRIARGATLYLMSHHLLSQPVRFDAVEVVQGSITYIPNAFQPGGMFFK